MANKGDVIANGIVLIIGVGCFIYFGHLMFANGIVVDCLLAMGVIGLILYMVCVFFESNRGRRRK